MKRLIPILLAILGLPAYASITFVQAQNSGNNSNCHATSASTGAACTVAATTAGNDVLVNVGWHTNTASLVKVVGSSANAVFTPYAELKAGSGTTGSATAWWVCRSCPSLTSVTPTFSATTKYEVTMVEYSGVTWMGITGSGNNGGSASASPGLTMVTGDNNDFILCGVASVGTSGVPTSNTGTLRKAAQTGSTTSDVSVGVVENTSASPGSTVCSATITSKVWSAVGIELRTTAPKTYIWPDCDTTHPCIIHHRDTMAIGNLTDTLTTPFYIRLQPSLAGNLIKLTMTYPSAKSVTAIASYNQAGTATGDTWTAGTTYTDTTFATTTDIRYVCAATTGTAEIRVTFSATFGIGDLGHFSYDEISGIASSSCGDGGTGTTATAPGNVQPGSITPSQTGDLIYTYTIDARGTQENGFASGWIMPDDQSALLWTHMYDNYAEMVRVYNSTSAINPTMYVNAIDPAQNDARWNTLVQAFKASSGAGTQPPTGQAWVVRTVTYRNSNAASSVLPITAFPNNGNALLVNTTQHVTQLDLSTMKDNYGTTYTSNTVVDTTFDPQQYTACLGGLTSGYNRDRAIKWTMTGTLSTPVELMDIAGAKTTGGSTGCIGNKAQNKTGTQAAVNNSNIVSSAFGTPFSFTPTINSGSTSLVVLAQPYGAGPPSGPCISGGVTPPSCTGNMSNFVFVSLWASGMTDGSHYSNGDSWGYYYTNSATAYSFDFLMANSVDSPGGGSTTDTAVTEIYAEPAPTGATRRRALVVNK